MPGPSFDNQETGQDWWDTYQQMQSFDWGGVNTDFTAGGSIPLVNEAFNIGYDFWSNQLSPYLDQDELDAGINPLSMMIEYGNIISPFGINPQAHSDISSQYDITRDLSGTQFGLDRLKESRTAGYSNLASVGSRSNLYEDYIQDIEAAGRTAEDEYGTLYSGYGTTFSDSIEDLIDVDSGLFGSGDWSSEEGEYINVPESIQDITSGQIGESIAGFSGGQGPEGINPAFQACVVDQMVASNDFTPEGFQQGSAICWEMTQAGGV